MNDPAVPVGVAILFVSLAAMGVAIVVTLWIAFTKRAHARWEEHLAEKTREALIAAGVEPAPDTLSIEIVEVER